MNRHDFSQGNVTAISTSILDCRNIVENYVLSTEAMPYSWDTGIVNTVVTWFEVLQVNSVKDQLERLLQKSDEKLGRVTQHIGSADFKAAQDTQSGMTSLSSLKEKFLILEQSSRQFVSYVGIFDALHSSILAVDEKLNQVDFDKLSEEDRTDYYNRLNSIPDDQLTEDDKARIQEYVDYLKDKFVVDDNLTEEEKRFISLYEKIHKDEEKSMNTFFDRSSKDGINENDKFNIKYIAYNSQGEYHFVFFKHISECQVATWTGGINGESIGSQYNTGTNMIYLNLSSGGLKDADGAYTTVFHEIGHSIDDLIAHGYDKDSAAKSGNANFFTRDILSDELFDIMYNDLRSTISDMVDRCNYSLGYAKLNDKSKNEVVEALLDGRKKWTTLNPYERTIYDAVKLAIEQSEAFQNHSVSDIVGGLTNNTIAGYNGDNMSFTSVGYGHERYNKYDGNNNGWKESKSYYWYDENGATYKQLSEFFAEYTSYIMTGQEEKLSHFRKVFPHACELMDKAISEKSNEYQNISAN